MDCQLPGSSGDSPWSFSGKSTGVGCHFFLQGIFPTQGLNPGLPHSRQTLYHLSHQGSGFPGVASGNESACQCRRRKRYRSDPWVGQIPWSRKWQTTPVFLPGKSQGQRSLVGYSPWIHRESDMTEQLSTHMKGICSLKIHLWNFLVIQWLGCHASTAGAQV